MRSPLILLPVVVAAFCYGVAASVIEEDNRRAEFDLLLGRGRHIVTVLRVHNNRTRREIARIQKEIEAEWYGR